MMDKSDKIFVAGYRGLVGSALIRRLEREGFHNLPRRDRAQLDFVNESAVAEFFRKEKPAVVIFAAAKVGGIKANNDFPVEFLLDNLRIQNNIFDLETSHVLAALLRKAHEAKTTGARELVVWGSGKPRREFLHADDLASACLFLLEHYDSPEIINVGWGKDIPIRELAELICDVVGFDGELIWDATKPDGTLRKLLDVTKLRNLGWHATIPLRDGIAQTYDWFLKTSAR